MYSARQALKMKEYKLNGRRSRVGLLDILFIGLFVLVIASIFSNMRLSHAMVLADEAIKSAQPLIQKEIVEVPVEVIKEDDRIIKLRIYLKKEASPLEPYSEIIIRESDKYGLDWTRLVAIACMESACGKRLPEGSHNAWGLGGSKFMYFNTWEEGIQYASWLLGTSYKQNENAGIKSKYCPASDGCNPAWATNVTKFSNDILALKDK